MRSEPRSLRITAVVPAHNGSKTVCACIDGLLAAGFDRASVVVVDDASTDDTATLAEDRGVNVIRLPHNVGAAAARNRGAEMAANADVLFFVDSDVEVHLDVRMRLVEFFTANNDFDAVFGCYDMDPAAPQPVSRARNLLHSFVHMENAGEVASFWTGIGAVRREVFERAGGFDATLNMMEDVEFGVRLTAKGLRIQIDPGLLGCHHKRWMLAGMFRTDLLDRAIPWARLLRDSGHQMPPDVLNINTRARLSVLMVAVACVGLLACLLSPTTGLVVIVFALLAVGALNADFLRFIQRVDGAWSMPAAFLVLVLYYFCGGLGFAWVASGLDRAMAGSK